MHHIDNQVRTILPIELEKIGFRNTAACLRSLPPLTALTAIRYRQDLSVVEVRLEDRTGCEGCLDLVRDCLTELHELR